MAAHESTRSGGVRGVTKVRLAVMVSYIASLEREHHATRPQEMEEVISRVSVYIEFKSKKIPGKGSKLWRGPVFTKLQAYLLYRYVERLERGGANGH